MRKNSESNEEEVKHWLSVARRFSPRGEVTEVRPHGSGLVNRTFLVTLEGGEERRFILQRIHTGVFREPELIMQNLRQVTAHVAVRLSQEEMPPGDRFEIPRVLLTKDGRDHWRDPDGGFWRAISYIEGAETFDTVQNTDHGREIGRVLGKFHDILSDLDPASLADTLPGFHVTPRYLAYFDQVPAEKKAPESPDVAYALRFVSERRNDAGLLEEARESGRLRLRPIHGDPKVNNVMMDVETTRAVGLIDLDTVKPGLVHWDIGDCLRSGCNSIGEGNEDWEAVRFDPALCRAILEGYFGEARSFLGESDYALIYDSVRLIAFELGLRFLTDHLEGDVYFRTDWPGHNLMRALGQFRLVESIEEQEADIRAIVEELR